MFAAPRLTAARVGRIVARAPLLLAFAALCATSDETHQWSYSGKDGPTHWGGTCRSGKAQSPIDIRTASAKLETLPALSFDYRPGPLHILDNGHSVQVDVEPGSSLTIGRDRYSLVQFHFHKPSEEAIDGRHYAMVAHLVHRDSTGRIAVVAVLLKAGAENPLIDKLWRNVPSEKGHEERLDAVTISPGQLLPVNRAYFTYQGSLTTPPCTEGVRWIVLKTPNSVSVGQIIGFGKFYRMNARPVQPANGREVEGSK